MDQRARVLYADADAAARERASAALADAFEVETAPDLESARRSLAAEPPACVVAGLDADALDDPAGLRTLCEASPSVPVVLFAAVGSVDQLTCAVAAGVAEFVRKGRSDAFDELATAVQRAVDRGPGTTAESPPESGYAAFFERHPEPAVEYQIADGSPVARSVNRAFESVFGTEAEAAIDNLLGSGGDADAGALGDGASSATDVVGQVSLETADGPREFRVRNVHVDGVAADGFLLCADVNERVERERELQRRNERLDQFASVVSHDLRNPMEVVKNRIQVSRQTGDYSHLDQALAAVDRMDGLLRELRQLARHGAEIGQREPVEIAAVAEQAWRHVATDGATLAVPESGTIRADSGRLTQLLENLFSNAVEHGSTSPGSQARQDAGRASSSQPSVADTPEDAVEHGSTSPPSQAPEDAVEHGSTSPRSAPSHEEAIEHGSDGDGELQIRVGIEDDCFYVEDDGTGIPPERRDEVFETGVTTDADGTGFGLTIVRQIAQAHGWEVRVGESAAGGARFEVRGVEFVDA